MSLATDPRLAPVLQRLEAGMEASVARYADFLRIPSISTDPAFAPDVYRAAQWAADQLTAMGFQAQVRETTGLPMVVAHHPGPEGAAHVPHLLYYGHFDVQPPEPLELWHSPPFEPTIVTAEHGPRMVARGAVDDKGQVMTFLEAFRAWVDVHGTLPIQVTVLLEGEEETGSPSLVPFLQANQAELSAPQAAVITDTNSWDIRTPAITTSLRGLVFLEVTLHGPSRDLHSGMYGGSATNPLNALTRVLAQLHDDRGRVQIPGFYDAVREPSAAELAAHDRLGFDEGRFLAEIGLTAPAGEVDRPALQRLWVRPTCDINGVWGGYTGAGAKTVIPAQASAKLSFRLVPDQDPEAVVAGARQFFQDRTPPGCRWTMQEFGKSAGFRVDPDSPVVRAAADALQDIYGVPAALVGSGGSIPVVKYMKDVLGLDSVLVGFGLEDDRIHSPNEKFELACLRNGMLSHAAMLARFASLPRP